MHQQVPRTRKKNDILGPWLIACCNLAPTLARQIWRHNYVIGRSEYLIFTFSESTFPWVYSLQFLFKSTHNSWRYKRKCKWVFFSEHSVINLAHYCRGKRYFFPRFQPCGCERSRCPSIPTPLHYRPTVAYCNCQLSHKSKAAAEFKWIHRLYYTDIRMKG